MRHTLFILSLLATISATAQTNTDTAACAEVLLETTEGNIRIKLYNETPKHRDNFLKLVKIHLYDSVLFHRTIPEFMIQTGDPLSKNAKSGEPAGNGSVDYTLPAEIRMPKIYHKRGAVAAARESDDINPEWRSDGCQFYIVWGHPNNQKYMEAQQTRLDTMYNDSIRFSQEALTHYTTIGGTPHLDGSYTVFGEVIDGLDVVEKIQAAETDERDRPIVDRRIIHATVTRDLPAKPKKKIKNGVPRTRH